MILVSSLFAAENFLFLGLAYGSPWYTTWYI